MATPSSAPDPQLAELLKKALAPSFALVRQIGAGGMGSVFVARDPVLKRLVAVKVMSPELAKNPDARARFEREAQAVAAISHPNVVAVYSVGELENGLPYLVMQYVEGRSMDERITSDGPLDVATAKRVLGEVASALAAAHKKGIIHRDIKPANILWDEAAGRALVTDFGIAAVLHDAEDQSSAKLTQTGTSIGTPQYMSPEQLLAEPVTEKTDVYSLGLLGYELLTGQGPYAVTSPREMMAAHLRDSPRKLSTLRADTDPEVAQLLESCLAKDAALRPSAEDVSKRLTHGAGVLLEWPPPGLEGVGDRFRIMLTCLTWGGLLLSAPLVLLSTTEPGGFFRLLLQLPVIAILVFFGVALFAGGAWNAVYLLIATRRAVAGGFGWITVAEAAADGRGDTGSLIAGAREYAVLSADRRSALRKRRLIAATLRSAAAVMPIIGVFVGLAGATRLHLGSGFLTISSIGLTLVLLVAARALREREDFTVRESRARLKTVVKRAADRFRFAEGWTTTYENVRVGQALGVGSKRGRWLLPLISAGVLLTVVAGAAVVFLFTTIMSGGSYMVGQISPNISWMTSLVTQTSRLERYRLPVDTTITPLQAGRAFVFVTDSMSDNTVLLPKGDIPEAFRSRAAGGIRPDIRAHLVTLARSDSGTAFRTLAHARTYDELAVRTSLGALDSTPLADIPLPRLGRVVDATRVNIAKAALAFEAGRTADAELMLREVMSVGFLMIHEGNSWVHASVGRNIVGMARQALSALYTSSNRSGDADFVSLGTDPQLTGGSLAWERQALPDVHTVMSLSLRVATDTSVPRGMRRELARVPLSYGPCFDMRQLLFGPDSAFTAGLASMRKSLVRFPSDSVWFLKIDHALERPFSGTSRRERNGALQGLAVFFDWLIGGRRFRSCASIG